jgi:NAD-dependent dihydropyrimidine dehydrogenase PreA subunit
MKELTYLKNGESLKVNEADCTGCGVCLEACPHAVFERQSGGGKVRVAHRARCMECGACALNCPAQAISVNHGVGCAAAIIGGMLKGGEASCDCGKGCC